MKNYFEGFKMMEELRSGSTELFKLMDENHKLTAELASFMGHSNAVDFLNRHTKLVEKINTICDHQCQLREKISEAFELNDKSS